ncbi:MAG: hypothetical protein ACQEP1_01525 [Nanobdellota archaeon]
MPEDYEIGADETAEVYPPDMAWTGGIDTCLGVGIVNDKKGYLGHFYGGEEYRAYELIDRAIEESGSISDLEVVLVGNKPVDVYDRKFLDNHKREKKDLVGYVEEKGIEFRNELEKNPDGPSYTLTVDPGRGVIDVAEDYL